MRLVVVVAWSLAGCGADVFTSSRRTNDGTTSVTSDQWLSVCLERRVRTIDVLTSRLVQKLDNLGSNLAVVHALRDWARWLHLNAKQPNCLELLDRLPLFGASLR